MVVIHWNCRGIKNKKESLELMIKAHNPAAILLQETKLKPGETINIRGYTDFLHSVNSEGNAKGGVAILAKSVLNPKKIDILNDIGKIQAVAVNLELPNSFVVCSVYMQKSDGVSTKEITALLDDLGEKALIGGDFNAHHELWGPQTNDRLGNEIAELIENGKIVLLNQDDFMYVDDRSLVATTLDLSMCTPILKNFFTWRVLDDFSSSDHLPVEVGWGSGRMFEFTGALKFSTEKADWGTFHRLTRFDEILHINDSSQVLSEYDRFVNDVKSAASASMLILKPGSYRHNVPWWNDDIKNAVRERKKFLRKFRDRV